MKQIYATLQIGEDEIRLLVGEYYNSRFNVIRCERQDCNGLNNDFSFSDRELVKKTVKSVCENAGKFIGAKIEQLILILPSYKMHRESLQVKTSVEGAYLSKSDVSRAMKEALHSSVDGDYVVVNVAPIKYTVAGISSRVIPLKQACESFTLDADLLCVSKDLAFDYVSLIDECGYKVMDICLDSYATAKEAALFEQTINQNMILLNVGKRFTSLALLSKGKLLSSEYLNAGLKDVLKPLTDTYSIGQDSAYRLLKYDTLYAEEYSPYAIFAWKDDKENMTINQEQLSQCVKPALDQLIEKIYVACKPILENGKTVITLVGEGSEMKAFRELLAERCDCKVNVCIPNAIGARDSNLGALYGSFFVYHDNEEIYGEHKCSINQMEFDNMVNRKIETVRAESLTSRIKSLFETANKKKEEIVE